MELNDKMGNTIKPSYITVAKKLDDAINKNRILEERWNELKEYIKRKYQKNVKQSFSLRFKYHAQSQKTILNKMKELENIDVDR